MDHQKYIRPLVLTVALVFWGGLVFAQDQGNGAEGAMDFRYFYQEGQQYRIVSQVYQTVYIDGIPQQDSYFLNRIAVTVPELGELGGYHLVEYNISQENNRFGEAYIKTRSYEAEFWRDELGVYYEDEDDIVPPVRNVPRFPDRPLAPGDTWTEEGYEVHEMDDLLGEGILLRYTMPVTYRYVGPVDGYDFDAHRIEIDYTLYEPIPVRGINQYAPRLVSGFSSQDLIWNADLQLPYSYTEEYEINLHLGTGQVMSFAGTAEAEVVEATPIDRDDEDEIRKAMEKEGYDDDSVRRDPDGITLVLDAIYFIADSDQLRPGEEEKLEEIAEILALFPDNDLFISGHTALAGSEAGRLILSEARARTVAQLLFEWGIREPQQVLVEGRGATEPVATNDDEEGRRKNRRVEIKILDN